MERVMSCCFRRIIPDKLPFSYPNITNNSNSIYQIDSIEDRIKHLKIVLETTIVSSQMSIKLHLSSILSKGRGSTILKHSGKTTIVGAILTMGEYFLHHSQDVNGKKANLYLGIGFALASIGVVIDILVRYLRNSMDAHISNNEGFTTESQNKLNVLYTIQEILDTVKKIFDKDGAVKTEENETTAEDLKHLIQLLEKKENHSVPNNLAIAVGELRRFFILQNSGSNHKGSDAEESDSDKETQLEMVNLARPSKKEFSSQEITKINSIVKTKIVHGCLVSVNDISNWAATNIPKEILSQLLQTQIV